MKRLQKSVARALISQKKRRKKGIQKYRIAVLYLLD